MKTFIVDAVAVGTAVAVFLILKPEGLLPLIAAAAAAVAVHIAAEKIFGERQEDTEDPAQKKKMSGEITQELRDAAVGLHTEFCNGNKAKDAPFAVPSVTKFTNIVAEFQKRKRALYKVIALTEYKNASYIEHGSDVAEQNLIQLAEILRIKLTILTAIGSYDYQYNSVKTDIETIIKKAGERLDEYSNLLTEAGRIKDGDDEAAENLAHIIERLETARKEDSKEFQSASDELGVTASGRDYGI